MSWQAFPFDFLEVANSAKSQMALPSRIHTKGESELLEKLRGTLKICLLSLTMQASAQALSKLCSKLARLDCHRRARS